MLDSGSGVNNAQQDPVIYSNNQQVVSTFENGKYMTVDVTCPQDGISQLVTSLFCVKICNYLLSCSLIPSHSSSS